MCFFRCLFVWLWLCECCSCISHWLYMIATKLHWRYLIWSADEEDIPDLWIAAVDLRRATRPMTTNVDKWCDLGPSYKYTGKPVASHGKISLSLYFSLSWSVLIIIIINELAMAQKSMHSDVEMWFINLPNAIKSVIFHSNVAWRAHSLSSFCLHLYLYVRHGMVVSTTNQLSRLPLWPDTFGRTHLRRSTNGFIPF